MDTFLPTNEDFIEQKLQERVDQLECPFNWMRDFKLVPSTQTNRNITETSAFTSEDCNQNFETYVKYMRTTYDLGIINLDNIHLVICEWDEFLRSVEKEDPFFIKLNIVFSQILCSSYTHILFKLKKHGEVEESVSVLEKTEKNDLFLAGINGVKAKFFETFGESGYKEVLVHVMLAVCFDPEEAEWMHLATSTLRNIHLLSIEYQESQRIEEFQLFQGLIHYLNNPSCLIYFGNYRLDVVNELISEHRYDYEDIIGFAYHTCGYDCFKCKEIHKYISQGLAFFKKALKAEEPKMETYLMVIKGVTKIPSFYRKSFVESTMIWIKEVEKNLYNQENHGNGEAFYVVWKYYQNLGVNHSSYVLYLTRSAVLNFPLAKKDLIPIKYRENVGCYNPQGDILEVMHLIPEKSNQVECLAQLIYYYAVINKSFAKALPFIYQLRKEVPDFYGSPYFQEHRSWFLMKDNKVDLTTELKMHVSFVLQD